MRIIIEPDAEAVAEWAAASVALAIRRFDPGPGRPFVLGLPTGSTPLGMYQELVRLHRAGIVSFRHTVTFNMDEYVGLPEDDPRSYHYYMRESFFRHVDIPDENIRIPDGNAPDIERECAEYESAVARAGGVNLFVGGIGSNGHVAFNEPGASFESRTRMVVLAENTRIDNARFFGGDPGKVPRSAITVGIGTIMDAEAVMLLATGLSKARALRTGVEDNIDPMRPVSALRLHPRAIVVCDEAAASELGPETLRLTREGEDSENDPRAAIG